MDDADVWKHRPELRRYFNKLELSLELGHTAGPSGVPVPHAGKYVVRPIYNLLGMGAGATIEHLAPDSKDIPPGYFWCEKFEGRHISLDLDIDVVGRCCIEPKLIVEGSRCMGNPLYKFDYWERLPIEQADQFLQNRQLLTFIWISLWNRTPYSGPLNVEFIGDKIIEVHFRHNPDFQNGESSLVVVWNGEAPAILNREFVRSEDDAGGYLPERRTGFLVRR